VSGRGDQDQVGSSGGVGIDGIDTSAADTAAAVGAGEVVGAAWADAEELTERMTPAAAAAAAAPVIGSSSAESGAAGSDVAGASGVSGVSPRAGSSSSRGSGLAGLGSPGSGSGLSDDEDVCGVCFDNSQHVAIKYCGHRLCVDCYRRVWEITGGSATCPFCRARLEGYMYLDWPLE
jgi:hypothetical protein